ncbi:MAG: DUF4157 domain-containing protein [bacterium]
MSEALAQSPAVQPAATPAEQTQSAGVPAVQATLARAAASREVQGDPAATARGGLTGGGALPHGAAIQAAFGEHDLAGVQATVGGPAQAAAAELGAVAFTQGEQVAFAGAPDLFTAAHEATHVLQQRAGMAPAGLDGGDGDALEQQADQVAAAVVQGEAVQGLLGSLVGPAVRAQQTGAAAGAVQRRRIPGEAELNGVLPGGGPDEAAHLAGLTRVLERSIGTLDDAQRLRVVERLIADATGAGFWEKLRFLSGLSPREQLLRIAGAMRATFPRAELGDPALIDSGPRPATADAANITTLVTNTNALFDQVLAPGRRADLEQVFGRGHVNTARARYTAAKRRMNTLHRQNKIVTDRSGYNAEVSLGGLTGPNQISLAPGVIDNPGDHENIVTMLHESMHAGNGSVDDFGYIGTPSFTQLEASVKLNNAAHYEVVPRRIFSLPGDYAGQAFVPAGTTSGGVTAPALTPREQAIRTCQETFRQAWTVGLNLHSLFQRVYANPRQWNTVNLRLEFGARAARHFSDALPFWSKVEKMTIHERSAIDPTTGNAATAPITQIDMALSEGVVRKLAQCMDQAPTDDAGAGALIAQATAAEQAAATTPAAEAELLTLLTLRTRVGNITGPAARDLRMIQQFNALGDSLADFLAPRNPADFAD